MTRKRTISTALFLTALIFICPAFGQTTDGNAAPSLPKGRVIPKEIIVVPHHAPTRHESVAFASLQGQLARQGAAQGLYIDNVSENSGYRTWLSLMERHHGSRITETKDLAAVLSHLAPKIAGYVLYDHATAESLNVATTLAAARNAILIETSLEKIARNAGLEKVADASRRTLDTLTPEELAATRPGLVIEIPSDLPAGLRDYAILGNIYSFPAENSPRVQKIMERFPAGSIALGWGNTTVGGEDDFIGRNSKLGIPMIPGDHIRNLSLLSALKNREPLAQAPSGAIENEAPKAEHIVTFAFTDGDNPSWLLYDFPSDKRWFGSPARGSLPMGWGLAPVLIELTPGVVEWFYRQAAPAAGRTRELFMVGPSGDGYFYPSQMPPETLSAHCAKLSALMGKADLRLVQILDFDSLERVDVWEKYLRQPNIGGLFYCDYHPYDKGKGRVVWVDGKPVVSSRAMLWGGIKGSDADSIAKLLNTASRDTTTTDAYSYIIVHAWTQSYEDVVKLAGKLNPDVRVVAPDEFIRLIKRAAPKKN